MIKSWFLNLPFVRKHYASLFEERIKELELEFHKKNFSLAQKDILETMRDDIEEQAEELASKKLNDLLSPADLTKIVSLDKQQGMIYIGGEKAEEAVVKNLQSEAQFILKSDIWKLLNETPKELAQRAMFLEGDSIDQLKKGRSILYTLSTQKNIVELLANYTHK